MAKDDRHPTSFRLTAEAAVLLERLKAALGMERGPVVELAIRELARKWLAPAPLLEEPPIRELERKWLAPAPPPEEPR